MERCFYWFYHAETMPRKCRSNSRRGEEGRRGGGCRQNVVLLSSQCRIFFSPLKALFTLSWVTVAYRPTVHVERDSLLVYVNSIICCYLTYSCSIGGSIKRTASTALGPAAKRRRETLSTVVGPLPPSLRGRWRFQARSGQKQGQRVPLQKSSTMGLILNRHRFGISPHNNEVCLLPRSTFSDQS